MRLRTFSLGVLALVIPLFAVSASASSIVLGSAANFAVLGATSVTNLGPTTINGGNVGVYSGTSITGKTICPGAVNCITITAGNTIGLATAANQSDLAAAISGLQGLSSLNLGTAGLSGNLIITPGVYSSGSTFNLNGVLTLNAQGQSNVAFVFLAGSSLTAQTGSVVSLINAGSNVGVYWVTGASASILSGASFTGNILAHTSITLGQGAIINCGSALANTGDVTMINNTISTGCNGSPFISSTTVIPPPGGTLPGPGTTPAVAPEPGTFVLLLSGLLAMVGVLTYRRLSGAKGGPVNSTAAAA
jgi:hypothetical protein